MRKLTSFAAAAAILLSTTAVTAQEATDTPRPIAEKRLSSDERSLLLNATYVVTGILLTFLLVQVVNDNN